jgi:heptosyltransferase-3
LSQRVLVMRGGALGDFILGLPALRALREAFPAAHLELIAPSAILPLASHLVDVLTPIERSEISAFFGDGLLPEELSERYAGFDLAVLWLADSEGLVRGHFEELGTKRVLQVPALPLRDARVHATDHLIETLRPLLPPSRVGVVPLGGNPGIDALAGDAPGRPTEVSILGDLRPRGDTPLPIIRPPLDAEARATDLLRRLSLAPEGSIVAIHPGSGGRSKCWPADRFAMAADLLLTSGRQVLLIQGPADEEVVASVRHAMGGESPPVAAGLPVEDLAVVLSICSQYLGNDSGVTHLAAAAGIPCVALFGPTDPSVWGPRGRYVTIIRGDQGRLEAISVVEVMAAITPAFESRGG